MFSRQSGKRVTGVDKLLMLRQQKKAKIEQKEQKESIFIFSSFIFIDEEILSEGKITHAKLQNNSAHSEELGYWLNYFKPNYLKQS